VGVAGVVAGEAGESPAWPWSAGGVVVKDISEVDCRQGELARQLGEVKMERRGEARRGEARRGEAICRSSPAPVSPTYSSIHCSSPLLQYRPFIARLPCFLLIHISLLSGRSVITLSSSSSSSSSSSPSTSTSPLSGYRGCVFCGLMGGRRAVPRCAPVFRMAGSAR